LPELLLKRLDLAADGRLRQRQFLRGARKLKWRAAASKP
jgi:hypothetical protein